MAGKRRAWELWSLGYPEERDEPMFVNAYADKGAAERFRKRLQRSHPGVVYEIRHTKRSSARQLFGTRAHYRHRVRTTRLERDPVKTLHYTISTQVEEPPRGSGTGSWRYIVRGAKGLVLDTRAGYESRSVAEGAAHAWLRSFLSRQRDLPRPKGHRKIERVLGEFKRGKLRTRAGSKVRSRKQAVAIALSEQRRAEGIRSRDPSKAEYEMRELRTFATELRALDRAPLNERKEAAAEFYDAMAHDPHLVAERVGWLLDGNFGYGAYVQANRVARNPRMNRQAWLVQHVGALEWQVPLRMVPAAWKKLTVQQKMKLDQHVTAVLNSHLRR